MQRFSVDDFSKSGLNNNENKTNESKIFDPNYDSFKSLEEKRLDEWKSCKNDEELARRLQQLEISQKNKQENSGSFVKDRTKEDELFALNLLKEEKKKEEERRLMALRKREEDELIARQLQDEEKRKKQLEDDEKLAKKLSDKEKKKNYIPPPPLVPKYYPSYNYNPYNPYNPHNPYNISYSGVNPLSNISYEKRQHAITIHNSYCSCGKISTWNNNHIFEFHNKYCGCDLLSYQPYSNQGKKHEHDYRCCTLNHLHTKSCKCYYRNHNHSGSCCVTYHKHTPFCHCTHK